MILSDSKEMNKGKCLFSHCPVNRDVFEMEDVKDSTSPRNVGCRGELRVISHKQAPSFGVEVEIQIPAFV